jgi:hypothetical protein
MPYAYLCGDAIRLELFPEKGVASAAVNVDGDFEERSKAHVDPDNLRAVLNGARYHLAGSGWMCTLDRDRDEVELELWLEGAPKRRCRLPTADFAEAIDRAFGVSRRAYLV